MDECGQGPTTPGSGTEGIEYADRQVGLQSVWWKRVLPVQAPYRFNLRRLDLGHTLELGCGIGRNLKHLRGDAVGVDHNRHAVAAARAAGLTAFTSEEFATSGYALPGAFDSLLTAHVIEHMNRDAAAALLRGYLEYVRPGGKVVVITPQERGFRSDPTHVEFFDFEQLIALARTLELTIDRSYSFPFPRWVGSLFVYNEFVLVARRP
jgi:SAM-dependent methyltransferase